MEIRGLTVDSTETEGAGDEGVDLWTDMADKDRKWPSQTLGRAALERLLAEAIEKMPQLERAVLSLYYYEDKTASEIASILDLQVPRVLQLKSLAILRLRSQMQTR